MGISSLYNPDFVALLCTARSIHEKTIFRDTETSFIYAGSNGRFGCDQVWVLLNYETGLINLHFGFLQGLAPWSGGWPIHSQKVSSYCRGDSSTLRSVTTVRQKASLTEQLPVLYAPSGYFSSPVSLCQFWRRYQVISVNSFSLTWDISPILVPCSWNSE